MNWTIFCLFANCRLNQLSSFSVLSSLYLISFNCTLFYSVHFANRQHNAHQPSKRRLQQSKIFTRKIKMNCSHLIQVSSISGFPFVLQFNTSTKIDLHLLVVVGCGSLLIHHQLLLTVMVQFLLYAAMTYFLIESTLLKMVQSIIQKCHGNRILIVFLVKVNCFQQQKM